MRCSPKVVCVVEKKPRFDEIDESSSLAATRWRIDTKTTKKKKKTTTS